jgi:hypothetical protein
MPKRTFATLAAEPLCPPPLCAAGWDPRKPVEFVMLAGTGCDAGPMVRFTQRAVAKNNLSNFGLNPLVGIIAGLTIVTLPWPAFGGMKAAVKHREVVADGRLPR